MFKRICMFQKTNMLRLYFIPAMLVISLAFTFTSQAATTNKALAKPLVIVTSFSILQDLTQNLAGDKAKVFTLVGPDSDAHVYQPKPSDAKLLASADLVIENGLGFEGWLSRLLTSSGFTGQKLVATQGLQPLYRANNPARPDPHAWHSFKAINIYIENITQALIKLSPENKSYFLANQKSYLAKLTTLKNQLQAEFKPPAAEVKVLVPHAAFAYLEEELNIKLLAPQGISTSSEPSAKQLAELINNLKDNNIQAIFTENLSNPRFMNTLSQASGLKIAGELYSDSLSTTKGPASTYLLFMQHNRITLHKALQ